jgi:hypothetical protein
MKYFSGWQPLVHEDQYTALLFGFMRHAPAALALSPWLSGLFGRPVELPAPMGRGGSRR